MKRVLFLVSMLSFMMLSVSCGSNPSEEQTQGQVIENTSEEDTPIDNEVPELGEIVDSGECGENATWQLDEYGTLVISGTGELYDFSGSVDLETGQWKQEHGCPWNDYLDYIKSIYIEDGITAIYGGSFMYMSSLISVRLPNTLKEITGSFQDQAFCECPNLKSVELPNGITNLSDAFVSCGLTYINIPDSVTTIGDEAFAGCCDLVNIEIPDSVTTIGENAFNGCSSLEYIYIPDSVTLIGDLTPFDDDDPEKVYSSTFYGCSNLQGIRLSNNIKCIGYGTFFDCPKLNYLYIPDSVTRIDQAFVGCTGLETIVIPSSVTTIIDGTFAEKKDGFYLKGQLDVTIQGAINSYAQQYAEENDFKFEVMINPN